MKRKALAILLALTATFSLMSITAIAASIPAKTVAPVIEILEERISTDGVPFLYCEFSVPQSVMDIVTAEGDVSVGFDYAVKMDNGQWVGGEGLAYYLTPGENIEGKANRYFFNIDQQNDNISGAIDIKAHSYSVKLLFLYNNQGAISYSDFGTEKSVGASGAQSPAPAAAGKTVTLDATIRDFHADGILFEGNIASPQGLVQAKLGAGKKPVFNLPLWSENWPGATQAKLDSLFSDVAGVNMKTTKTLTFTADSENFYVLDSSKTGGFFPIDKELFGNEDRDHNFWFSMECHAKFNYQGFEEFEFVGDDDVWVFIDGVLVIDIGGVHGASGKNISLPELVSAGTLDIKKGETVDFDFFYMERHTSESNFYARTNIDFTYTPIASGWATAELQKADELGLIPDSLKTADLTKNITRAEFAAVAVKVYEKLANTKALPATVNPFKDTSDAEVLKAYNTGLMVGIAADKFDPNALLNREQAATALTRVFKRATIPAWTFATDASYTLKFTQPASFADDAQISAWAKPSVYFMVANEIIKGVGGNKFAPRAVTSAEQAQDYASATREQALVIAVRMVESLGGKAAEFTAV